MVYQRPHLGQHGGQILVGHGAKHGVRGREIAHGIQVGRERRHRMGVVRHIQHQCRLPRHDLKTARQLDQRQAIAHGLRRHGQARAQRFKRRQHPGRIHQLVGPAQRRIGQPGITPPAPGPAPLLLVARKIEVVTKTPEVGPHFARMVDHALRRHRVAHHHRAARAHDAGLFTPDAFAVRPQVFGVVDVDAGDDGAVCVDDVGGVQPAAQPHLQDGHIQQRMAHQPQDGQRGEFKVRQRNIIAIERSCAFHRFKVRYQIRSIYSFAMHAAALFKMHQVRRGVDPGAKTGLLGHGLQHGAGRALAIGAGDGDHRAVKTQAHAGGHFANPLQAHVDVLRVQPLAMAEPAFQCVNFGLHTRPIVA